MLYHHSRHADVRGRKSAPILENWSPGRHRPCRRSVDRVPADQSDVSVRHYALFLATERMADRSELPDRVKSDQLDGVGMARRLLYM